MLQQLCPENFNRGDEMRAWEYERLSSLLSFLSFVGFREGVPNVEIVVCRSEHGNM